MGNRIAAINNDDWLENSRDLIPSNPSAEQRGGKILGITLVVAFILGVFLLVGAFLGFLPFLPGVISGGLLGLLPVCIGGVLLICLLIRIYRLQREDTSRLDR